MKHSRDLVSNVSSLAVFLAAGIAFLAAASPGNGILLAVCVFVVGLCARTALLCLFDIRGALERMSPPPRIHPAPARGKLYISFRPLGIRRRAV